MNALAQERTSFLQLFPGPEDGRVVEINPPPFYWLRVPGVEAFTVHLEAVGGSLRASHRTPENHWTPAGLLAPGTYRWDLEGNGKRRGWWTFTLSKTAAVQQPPTAAALLARVPQGHPRHYLRRGDAKRVCARHRRHLPALRRNLALALSDGLPPTPDQHLYPDPISRNLRYREWTNLARKYIDRNLVACVLGRLLFADEEAAAMGRRLLLAVCAWNPEGPCSPDGPWGDEVGLSLLRCLPFAIDGLAAVLAPEELAFAKTALAAHARAAHRRMLRTDFTNTPGNSHVGRLGGYLGEAALILHGFADSAECEAWLAYAMRIYAGFFPFFGGPDGGWAEGVFYATSYTRWYLPFFLMVERLSGFSFLERPFYRNVARFFLHFAREGWEVHPFGDGWWCHPEDQEWPGFFGQDPLRVYADRFGSPAIHRARKRLPVPERLELHLLDLFVPPALLRPSRRKVALPDAKDVLFPDGGFASLQCDLFDEKKNTALVVRASKFGNGSHQHADQGSFSILRRGKGLIVPSGTFGAQYGTAHHVRWTRQTRAHNCLLIGGEGQVPGHLGAARFLGMDEGKAGGLAYTHLVAALTLSYAGVRRYHRHFWFFKPDLILVVDDLLLAKPQRVTACLHSLRRPRVGKGSTSLRAEGVAMEVALFAEGRALRPRILDRYPVPVNEGVPARFAVSRPELFHWNWEVRPAKRHFLPAVFALDRAFPKIRSQAGQIVLDEKIQVVETEEGIRLTAIGA
ncbi:MAG: heparinase II/III family protein [Spirochaetes bacterium]|nr:heparinase II/III family protein [Spirochaetota bacterium]